MLTAALNERPDPPIGVVRPFNIHQIEGYAFLESVLDRAAMRRGLGLEAMALLVLYGKDSLGIRRIEAKVFDDNRLSINSMRRHGFTLEGTLRKAGWRDGAHHDLLIFSLIDEEIERVARGFLQRGRPGEEQARRA